MPDHARAFFPKEMATKGRHPRDQLPSRRIDRGGRRQEARCGVAQCARRARRHPRIPICPFSLERCRRPLRSSLPGYVNKPDAGGGEADVLAVPRGVLKTPLLYKLGLLCPRRFTVPHAVFALSR